MNKDEMKKLKVALKLGMFNDKIKALSVLAIINLLTRICGLMMICFLILVTFLIAQGIKYVTSDFTNETANYAVTIVIVIALIWYWARARSKKNGNDNGS